MKNWWRTHDTGRFTPGLWVEVTPELAAAAGVDYRGTSDNWHQAQYALLVGYTPTERNAIIETLINQFKSVFRTNPVIAGAWGIDSASLGTLHAQGLQIWMSVREQSGTDSYTNDGAPVHYPYFAQADWYLQPSDNHDNLLVIKHTTTDPLANYGDTTSSFTSQANDYALDNRTLDNYFIPLIRQAMSQPGGQRGWAVVGLENSMSDIYQTAYVAQLDALATDIANSTDWQIIDIPTLLSQASRASAVSVYAGHNLITRDPTDQAWWIQTSAYRLRLRATGERLFISDLRFYDPAWSDYYNDHQARGGLYQIVPPALDASLHQITTCTGWGWWRRCQLRPLLARVGDVHELRGFRLPAISQADHPQLTFSDDTLTFAYHTVAGEPVQLTFTATDIFSSHQPSEFGNWTQIIDQPAFYPVTRVWQPTADGQFQLVHQTFPDLLASARAAYRAVLLPEIAPGMPEATTSAITVHNRFAGAGRNPVRLILAARHRLPVHHRARHRSNLICWQPRIDVSGFHQ